jgi:replicative DNA helicase
MENQKKYKVYDGQTGRVMPHDDAAEQAVIGALIYDNSGIDKVTLAPDDFYSTANKLIYSAIIELSQKGQVADFVTVCEQLTSNGNINKIGGHAYVSQTVETVVSPSSVVSYARIVREKSVERRIISEAHRIIEAVYDQTETSKAKLEEAQKTILNLSLTKESDTMRDSKAILKTTWDGIENRYQHQGGLIGHSTGIMDLDSCISGLIGGDLIILAGRPGMGKAQPIYTPVLTANGEWKSIGSLRVGELLASIDGRKSTVEAINFRGNLDTYKIYFSDGRSTVVAGDHLWQVGYREWRKDRLFTTDELLVKLKYKRYNNRLYIPVISGDFGVANYDVPVDPYVLGCLIGDGDVSSPTPRMTSIDEQIIENIKKRLPGGYSIRKSSSKYQYSIVTKDIPGRSMINGNKFGGKYGDKYQKIHYKLTEALKSIGLYGKYSYDKFIPEIYFKSPLNARIDLLRGLFDTDGWVEKNKAVRFSSASRKLAEDVQALIRSIGGLCSISVKKGMYVKNGERKYTTQQYVCKIRHEHAEQLFLSDRKKELARRTKNTSVRLNIKKIEKIESAECCCISVSHKTGLYITNDYIVTHNSAVAGNIAATTAEQDIPTLIFSLEMPAESVMTRILARYSGINSRSLRRGQLREDQWGKAVATAGQVGSWPLWIDDKVDVTPQEIRAKARRMKKEIGLGLLVVDYIQLVRPTGKHDSREQAVADISRVLKAIARELNIPVIGLSQLNRQVDSRPDKHPMLSDLRESGAIEQDADIIIFIYRDEVYNKSEENPKRGTAELDIAKHRNGETGRFEVVFDAKTQTVRNKA